MGKVATDGLLKGLRPWAAWLVGCAVGKRFFTWSPGDANLMAVRQHAVFRPQWVKLGVVQVGTGREAAHFSGDQQVDADLWRRIWRVLDRAESRDASGWRLDMFSRVRQ